ncbi:MAG: hypothetical protein D6713_01345 [Deltaproteobacteria bacterium]|nr:MAG: hypothetical protein D6713_01345 [Deltaproteobacteria bacterium]
MAACWRKGESPDKPLLCPYLKFTVRRDFYEKIPARLCTRHQKNVPDDLPAGTKPPWCTLEENNLR